MEDQNPKAGGYGVMSGGGAGGVMAGGGGREGLEVHQRDDPLTAKHYYQNVNQRDLMTS